MDRVFKSMVILCSIGIFLVLFGFVILSQEYSRLVSFPAAQNGLVLAFSDLSERIYFEIMTSILFSFILIHPLVSWMILKGSLVRRSVSVKIIAAVYCAENILYFSGIAAGFMIYARVLKFLLQGLPAASPVTAAQYLNYIIPGFVIYTVLELVLFIGVLILLFRKRIRTSVR